MLPSSEHETLLKWSGKCILDLNGVGNNLSLKKKMRKKNVFFSVFPMFSKKVPDLGHFWDKNRGGCENATLCAF